MAGGALIEDIQGLNEFAGSACPLPGTLLRRASYRLQPDLCGSESGTRDIGPSSQNNRQVSRSATLRMAISQPA
jgi:hypothetical protein